VPVSTPFSQAILKLLHIDSPAQTLGLVENLRHSRKTPAHSPDPGIAPYKMPAQPAGEPPGLCA
jgi:hypothetical protein